MLTLNLQDGPLISAADPVSEELALADVCPLVYEGYTAIYASLGACSCRIHECPGARVVRSDGQSRIWMAYWYTARVYCIR